MSPAALWSLFFLLVLHASAALQVQRVAFSESALEDAARRREPAIFTGFAGLVAWPALQGAWSPSALPARVPLLGDVCVGGNTNCECVRCGSAAVRGANLCINTAATTLHSACCSAAELPRREVGAFGSVLLQPRTRHFIAG